MRAALLIGAAACGFHGRDVEVAPVDASAEVGVPDAPGDADTLHDGLIAWYQLDLPPPGVDSSTGAHTPDCGPNDPTVCPMLVAPGKIGAAYEFDGSKTWLDVPLGNDLQPAQLTAALFVRFTSFPGNNAYQCPLGKVLNKTMPNDNTWQLCLHGKPGNALEWMFITESGPPFDQLFVPATLVQDTWYHVAISFDGTTKKVYVDGALQPKTSTPSGALIYDMGALTIGSDILTTGAIDVPFHGDLDDVRIYDRALSDAEIAALSQQ